MIQVIMIGEPYYTRCPNDQHLLTVVDVRLSKIVPVGDLDLTDEAMTSLDDELQKLSFHSFCPECGFVQGVGYRE